MGKTALITGITGQDGSYLAELLLHKGYDVHGIIRRSSSFNTGRLDSVYTDPHIPSSRIHLHYGDLADGTSLHALVAKIRPDEVYNLGAQSHVRVSFDTPVYTGDATGLGTCRILEAIRQLGLPCRFYQAGSSEMFGGLYGGETILSERSPFHPRSPYGAAKVYAHWAAVNYREAHGMFATNGILFNHECVTEETPVIFRKHGMVDIREIQDLVPHRTNPKSGKKWQTTPNDLEIWDGSHWTKVTCATATWNDGDKKVFSVQARGGHYRATGEHISFLEGKVESKTSDLKTGDRLHLFNLPKSTGDVVSVSEDEARFLGRMAGDGYVRPDGGSARFTNTDKELRQSTAVLFRKITGGVYREDFSKKSGYTGGIIPSMEFSNAQGYFYLWRLELYDERGKKKVPLRILNSSPSVREAFLSGYNDADGLRAGNYVDREFKSFKTNSAVLAQGLCFLAESLGYRQTIYCDRSYYTINVGLQNPVSGIHLQKPLEEIRSVEEVSHVGWLFDLATESQTFSAGIGQTWIHNSPRRGETFVTRKITRWIANYVKGLTNQPLYLGNLGAKRDWGYAPEYVCAMWRMLQADNPGDYVIATGETHSVQEFVEAAFLCVGLDPRRHIKIDPNYFRPSEVDVLLGDARKALSDLKWAPKTKFADLVQIMVKSEIDGQESGLTSIWDAA